MTAPKRRWFRVEISGMNNAGWLFAIFIIALGWIFVIPDFGPRLQFLVFMLACACAPAAIFAPFGLGRFGALFGLAFGAIYLFWVFTTISHGGYGPGWPIVIYLE